MEPKYITRFVSEAKVVAVDENVKKEAFASLEALRGLMPAGFNVSEDSDLMFIASNLVACNYTNANGDCLPNAVALKMYKTFLNKFVDIEHKRDKIVGFILNVGLTEFETNRILTEEEASLPDARFNIAYVACIWRAANPKLANFLLSASNETSKYFNSVSSSFEVGFDDFDVAVGKSKDVAEAALFPEESRYTKYLLANGGSGVDEEGNLVFRSLKDGVIGMGAGLVSRPASQVKGVLTIEDMVIEQEHEHEDDEELTEEQSASIVAAEIEPGVHLCNLEMLDGTFINEIRIINKKKLPSHIKAKFVKNIVPIAPKTTEVVAAKDDSEQKTEKINIQTEKHSVNLNITKPMKLENVEQIVASWNELVKSETAAADITKLIADEIAKHSEKYSEELKKRDTLASQLEQAKAAAEAKVTELSTTVSELAAKLNAIEEAKAAEAKQKAFQDRMSGLDAEFDLSDEEREIIASEIKDLDEPAFEAYAKKAKVLMKEKSKAYKAEKAKCMKDKMAEAKVNVEIDAKTLDFTQIVASAQETSKSDLPNAVTQVNEELKSKMANAFGTANITLNGKEIKQ